MDPVDIGVCKLSFDVSLDAEMEHVINYVEQALLHVLKGDVIGGRVINHERTLDHDYRYLTTLEAMIHIKRKTLHAQEENIKMELCSGV